MSVLQPNTKVCKKCGETKEFTEYSSITRGKKKYLLGTCKSCERNRYRVKNRTTRVLYTDAENKECGKCGRILPHSEFAKKRNGLKSTCSSCSKEYYQQWYIDNATSHKANASSRKKSKGKLALNVARHKLSVEEYQRMWLMSEGRCRVCLVKEVEVIDHDHSCCHGVTGCQKCVRGLLCRKCNGMLGNAGDSVPLLQAAISYLDKNMTLLMKYAEAGSPDYVCVNLPRKAARHKLTEGLYSWMDSLFEGKCWICRVKPATCIDHDHSCCSGQTGCLECVRGVLCHNCNIMLGQAKDDVSLLVRAITYLEEPQLAK